VVRNGCEPTDSLSEGVWFVKDSGDGWIFYDQWTGRTDTDTVFTSRDVFLPVQVVMPGHVRDAKAMRKVQRRARYNPV
jgi:hypothetical protein